MALSQRTTTVRVRMRDNDGTESTCECNLLASVAPDDAVSFLSAWAALVQALSSATIISTDVILRWTDPTPGAATFGSDCFRMGTFLLDTASSDISSVRVPALDSSFLVTTGPFADIAIDLTLAPVIALVSALTGGISGVEPCDPFASDLITINAAYIEQFA